MIYRDSAAQLARIEALGGRVVGRSRGGAPLYAIAFGDGPVASAILGGLHPIEWIGVEVALALCERLAAAPPPGRRVIALPLINIDGYRTVEDDRRAGRRRWHRRNAGGVDLNRNFPTHFVPRRRALSAWGWGGPSPLSEPECAAVARALRGAGVDRAASLHSIGRKVLIPYGGRWRRPARFAELHAAASAIAARMPERYTVSQTSRWVPGAFAYGMELDWLHDELGALAVLVECTRGGASITRPGTWLDPFRWFNPWDPEHHVPAIAAAIEPFLRGT